MKIFLQYNDKNRLSFLLFSLFFTLFIPKLQAQLLVNPAPTPQQLVNNTLIGTGVTVSNITYTGSLSAIAEFDATNTVLAIQSGVLLSSGNAVDAVGPNNTGSSGTDLNQSGDVLLTNIAGMSTFDAAVLEFDFVPTSDTIKFNYSFGSEEYLEFVNAGVNDAFGFFISGPNPAGGNYVNHNIALIPGTTTPVTIDNVNNISNSAYYINNGDGSTAPYNSSTQYIQYDGYTVPLTALAPVVPCQQYHIKIAIADGGDGVWDSGVFLEANSFTTNSLNVNITYSTLVDSVAIEGCNDVIVGFKTPTNTPVDLPVNFTLSGTATNNVDYTLTPTNVVIPAGSDTATLTISPLMDGITEGIETIIFDVQTSVCSNDTFTIEIHDNDYLNIVTSPDTTICDSIDVGLWVNASGGYTGGGNPYHYQWSTGDTTANIVVAPQTTTTFYVTVTEDCGQSLVDSVTVFAFSGTADVSPDTFICAGETVILEVSTGNSFLWSTGDTTQSISVSPLHTTTYYVTATGACSGYDTVTVTVQPLPIIQVMASQEILIGGETTVITASGADIYLWSSNPNDITLIGQEDNSSITVTPQQTTTYTVVGSDSILGCSTTKSIDIYVEPTFYIPNSFSPNGDGINDHFQVFGSGILDYEIFIFDRWGELIYYSKDMNEHWDGKKDNRIVPEGVYLYKILISTSINKDKFPYYGKITLIR